MIFFHFISHARGFFGFGIDEGDVADIDGDIDLNDGTLRCLLGRLAVFFVNVDAFDDHLVRFREDGLNDAFFAFVAAGDDDDFVTFLILMGSLLIILRSPRRRSS